MNTTIPTAPASKITQNITPPSGVRLTSSTQIVVGPKATGITRETSRAAPSVSVTVTLPEVSETGLSVPSKKTQRLRSAL